jgi:tight adherence protein B
MVVLLGILLALGLLGMVRLARGQALIPPGLLHLPRRRSRRVLSPKEKQTMAAGVAAAVLILLVSRNLVFAVIGGSAVVLWPMIAGGGKLERAGLTKLEGLAQWVEALRDLIQQDAGLESAIPKTVDGAADVLAAPLSRMKQRLRVKVPLPAVLSLFADDLDDAKADQVVAALSLAARQKGGKLSAVLTAQAEALREELDIRTKVMRERNSIRREAAQVAVLSAALILGASLFTPPAIPNGDTGAASTLLPLLLAAAYLFVFSRVRKLAEPEREPRFLSSSTEVLEAASYKPKAVTTL